MKLYRRQFLKTTALSSGLAFCPCYAVSQISSSTTSSILPNKNYYPAKYYKKLNDGIIECTLCPRRCQVSDLERGYCGVRENISGEYYTLVHSKVCSANVDPIEKKPFFHFMPGSKAFSIATAGCNMNCKFCQNWSISQFRPEDVNHFELLPDKCIDIAKNNKCVSVAYTYSEPVIFYEYMLDCAKEAKQNNMRSVVITAGFIEKEPLNELIKSVDAIKVDLKAFTESYYNDICNGNLKPILETLIKIKSSGVWLEIVYLMLPGLNDSTQEISELCNWLYSNLGSDVPIHFSKFHPAYLMINLPSTPLESLEKAYDIAKNKGLHYVYIGNVYGHKTENTYCHNCSKLLIDRSGFQINVNKIINGECLYCQTSIPGVWI